MIHNNGAHHQGIKPGFAEWRRSREGEDLYRRPCKTRSFWDKDVMVLGQMRQAGRVPATGRPRSSNEAEYFSLMTLTRCAALLIDNIYRFIQAGRKSLV